MRTEISTKFTAERVADELAPGGAGGDAARGPTPAATTCSPSPGVGVTAPVRLSRRRVTGRRRCTGARAAEAELAADALWRAGAAAIEERPRRAATGEIVLVAAPAAGGDAAPLLAAVAGRWPAEVVRGRPRRGARRLARRTPGRCGSVALVVRPPWVPAPAGGADGGSTS